MQRNNSLYRLLITAVLLAIGMVLPFLLGQSEAFGKLISPLHIPAFICGLTCGWGWGAALGFALPILRGLIFSMPPFPATGIPMAFELMCYGLVTGAFYPPLRKVLKDQHVIAMVLAMLPAMIIGRFAGGAAKAVVMGLQSEGYSFSLFFAAYFTGTLPGSIIQLFLCPYVATMLEQAKLSPLVK